MKYQKTILYIINQKDIIFIQNAKSIERIRLMFVITVWLLFLICKLVLMVVNKLKI